MTQKLSIPGFTFAEIHDEVTSTMDLARDMIPALRDGAGVVCALSQSAGRGRQGRKWSSTSGAMMATFLFQTSQPLASLSGYSLLVGLGLVDAFERFGSRLQLKWPNDLVVVRDDSIRKVGGILIEVQDLGETRVILVGVGVNLVRTPEDVAHAMSIEEIAGSRVTVPDALTAVSEQLRLAHELFVSFDGFPRFQARWEDASCFMKGETEITLDLGGRQVAGIYAGIDERGSLMLTVDGGLQSFHSGHLLGCRRLRAAERT
jgi:biotin-[acetyl-CoA-carboxylase] ligase BirA-like protein